jgi:hypothetical protein
MRKIVASAGLTLRLKHNYTPVSNFQIQNKTNPIVAVSIGSDREKLFDLHFRVPLAPISSSKTQSPALLKTSSVCCSALPPTKDVLFHLSATTSTTPFLAPTQNWAISPKATVPSLALPSGMSPSNYPTTGLDC